MLDNANVRVNQTRDHRPAWQGYDLGTEAWVLCYLRRGADRKNLPVGNGHRFRNRKTPIVVGGGPALLERG
jgi:hypothetical protein